MSVVQYLPFIVKFSLKATFLKGLGMYLCIRKLCKTVLGQPTTRLLQATLIDENKAGWELLYHRNFTENAHLISQLVLKLSSCDCLPSYFKHLLIHEKP